MIINFLPWLKLIPLLAVSLSQSIMSSDVKNTLTKILALGA